MYESQEEAQYYLRQERERYVQASELLNRISSRPGIIAANSTLASREARREIERSEALEGNRYTQWPIGLEASLDRPHILKSAREGNYLSSQIEHLESQLEGTPEKPGLSHRSPWPTATGQTIQYQTLSSQARPTSAPQDSRPPGPPPRWSRIQAGPDLGFFVDQDHDYQTIQTANPRHSGTQAPHDPSPRPSWSSVQVSPSIQTSRTLPEDSLLSGLHQDLLRDHYMGVEEVAAEEEEEDQALNSADVDTEENIMEISGLLARMTNVTRTHEYNAQMRTRRHRLPSARKTQPQIQPDEPLPQVYEELLVHMAAPSEEKLHQEERIHHLEVARETGDGSTIDEIPESHEDMSKKWVHGHVEYVDKFDDGTCRYYFPSGRLSSTCKHCKKPRKDPSHFKRRRCKLCGKVFTAVTNKKESCFRHTMGAVMVPSLDGKMIFAYKCCSHRFGEDESMATFLQRKWPHGPHK